MLCTHSGHSSPILNVCLTLAVTLVTMFDSVDSGIYDPASMYVYLFFHFHEMVVVDFG